MLLCNFLVMKVYRHKNGFLYTIEQVGRGKTISTPNNWKRFHGLPCKTNISAPIIDDLGEEPNLKDFKLIFEE